MKSLYLILSCIFLLTFGPFNSAFSSSGFDWNIITFSLTSLIFCLLLFHERKVLREKNTLLVTICLIYAGIIAVNSAFHGIALNALPDELNINLMQHKAVAWKNENLKFTVLYLFFPLFILIQHTLLRRVELQVVIRLFASAMTLSLIILFYQKYYDITFLNQPYWQEFHRVGGLSTDPNAFAMTAFLVIPLFALGIYTETTKIFKIFYILLIVSLIAGVLFTGSRTALGGISLLILSLPVIHALAKKEMTARTRLALFISPFVLLLLIILLLPYFSNKIQSSAISMERFISTIKGFKEGGINSALLKGEQRGTNYLIAWDLLSSSPLAGWGPGGFYKESPLFLYIRSGASKVFISDSALNHYLMIGGDFGLPILLINMIIIISPLVIAFIVLRKLSDTKKRYVVAIFLVVNILFLIMINTIPPSYFPDLIWVWTAQLAYMVIMGEQNGIRLSITSRRWKNIFYFSMIIAVFLVVFGSYQTTFGPKGYLARQNADWWPYKYARHCYDDERLQEGIFRWCKKDSSLQFNIRPKFPLPGTVYINFRVDHPDIGQEPVRVSYGGRNGPVHDLLFKDHNPQTVEIPLSGDYLYEIANPFKANLLNRYFVLSLDVSRTWVPKDFGVNDDTRELGVGVLILNEENFFR